MAYNHEVHANHESPIVASWLADNKPMPSEPTTYTTHIYMIETDAGKTQICSEFKLSPADLKMEAYQHSRSTNYKVLYYNNA